MDYFSATNNSNSPVGIAVFAVVFIAFIVLVVGLYVRRREITFEGVVIDKDILENQVNNNMNTRPGISMGDVGMNGMNNVTHTYRIKVKTDAGKEVNYSISEGKYEIIKIGDRVSKAKGTTEIEITPAVNPPQPPTALPPAPPPASGTLV